MPPPRNRNPGFSRRVQLTLFLSYVVAGGGALLGAVLVAISAINPGLFAALRSGVAEVTTPAAAGLSFVRRAIIDLPGGFGDYFNVVDDNRHMRAQLESEREVVLRARTLNIENQRLRRLLALRDAPVTTIVSARLVNSTPSSTRRFATLYAGFFQGVRSGQPVRGPEGLIGRVIETGPNTARVLLITDPESIVPVKRTRDGLPAILSGRGDGQLEVRGASSLGALFLPGDAFVTSGSGGLYPPGIPVGRASAKARDVAAASAYANPDALDFSTVLAAYLPELQSPQAQPPAAAPAQPKPAAEPR